MGAVWVSVWRKQRSDFVLPWTSRGIFLIFATCLLVLVNRVPAGPASLPLGAAGPRGHISAPVSPPEAELMEAADGRAQSIRPDTYHENRIEWNAELLKTNTLTR